MIQQQRFHSYERCPIRNQLGLCRLLIERAVEGTGICQLHKHSVDDDPLPSAHCLRSEYINKRVTSGKYFEATWVPITGWKSSGIYGVPALSGTAAGVPLASCCCCPGVSNRLNLAPSPARLHDADTPIRYSGAPAAGFLTVG